MRRPPYEKKNKQELFFSHESQATVEISAMQQKLCCHALVLQMWDRQHDHIVKSYT